MDIEIDINTDEYEIQERIAIVAESQPNVRIKYDRARGRIILRVEEKTDSGEV